MREELIKSIDLMINEMLEQDESLNKAIDIVSAAKTTADEVTKEAPKGEDDKKRKDRPKEINGIDKEKGIYDADISESGKEEDVKESSQVKEKNQIKKSEIEELMMLRAEKAERELELKKAEDEQKQESLIKSVIEKTASKYEAKLEEMQKAFTEQTALLKSVIAKPQRQKSITNIAVLEKSQEDSNKVESFTKSEILDVAEELVRKGELSMEHVIELENCGNIFNAVAKAKLEKALNK